MIEFKESQEIERDMNDFKNGLRQQHYWHYHYR